MKEAPQNGTQALKAEDWELYEYLFLAAINRGILMSPYFNIMAIMSPKTTQADVDYHTSVFRECVAALTGDSDNRGEKRQN